MTRSTSKKGEDPHADRDNPVQPSRASVGRLSLYLRRLEFLHREGTTKVSSRLLGDALGVTDAQVSSALATWRALCCAIGDSSSAAFASRPSFTPQVLRLPVQVSVVSVDLTVQFEQLAFLVQMGDEDQ